MFLKSIDFMNKTGLEYWLDFGTLLGYHREKGIIPHDIDVDYSMPEEAYDKILRKMDKIPPGFSWYDTSHRHHGPKIYMNYKGFDIDVYFYKDLGEAVRSTENTSYPNERQDIPKSLVFPLKEGKHFGQLVKVPNQVKEYLEYIYGYIGKNGKRDTKTGFWIEA
tara:strand:- start:5016 stop:5507 length:492 start_codon:yes stop_codon:yes gene_type:complete